MENRWLALIDDKEISLKVLETPLERAVGYQGSKIGPSNKEGLLFLFANENNRKFHMRNVCFDLELLGFDKDGVLRCVLPMQANSNEAYHTPACKFIIEVSSGWSTELVVGETLLRLVST